MIRLKDPCVIECDFADPPVVEGGQPVPCGAHVEGHVFIGASGLVAMPSAEAEAAGWDAAIGAANGLMICRCPEHPFAASEKTPIKSLIQPVSRMQVGPRGVRPMNGHGGKH